MPETTEPQAGTGTTTDEKAPPWTTETFDPERAWKKIQALEADKARLAARPVLTDEAAAKIAEHDRVTKASQTELEQKTEELTRWQNEAQRFRGLAVSSRIEALAGQDFADPSDAAAALPDPSQYLDAGGVIDEARIKADLAAVLERKPHWRRQESASGPRVPAPNAAQGAGGSATSNDPAQHLAAIIRGRLS